MNTKPTVPLLVTLAPAIATLAPPTIIGGLIGGAILLVLNELFPDNEKPPEILPATPEVEANRKPIVAPVFRQVPAVIPAKPARPPALPMPRVTLSPAAAIPIIPKNQQPAPAPAVKASVPAAPLPIKKKLITREDLAAVFHRGTRSLNRTAAVAALKKLGFGKSAAYEALTPAGRFATWLRHAPDGIITWTDGRTGQPTAVKAG